jgi:hypothetical protein
LILGVNDHIDAVVGNIDLQCPGGHRLFYHFAIISQYAV